MGSAPERAAVTPAAWRDVGSHGPASGDERSDPPTSAATVDDCTLLQFPKVSDQRGNLTFIEGARHVPFDIRRTFYVYDIPSGEQRGAHAHHVLHQVIICLSGSLDVQIDDGHRQRVVHLNRPWLGLHVPPMIWAAEGNFDPGTVYVVLASEYYDEQDYIRDYDMFLRLVQSRGS